MGGKGGQGGKGGKGGSSGRGAVAGTTSLGGAGAGNSPICEDTFGAAGITDYVSLDDQRDGCCVGDAPWGADHDYYASDVAGCGEARTCRARVYRNDHCNDWVTALGVGTQCCADGRWHLVKYGYQLIDTEQEGPHELVASALSPACGGTAWSSARALHCDGASYLTLPAAADMGWPAIEIWFRTTEPTAPLLSSASTRATLYLQDGRLCFYPNVSPSELCTNEADLADGAWHHAAFSARGTPSSGYFGPFGGLYVDGELRVKGESADAGLSTTFYAGFGRVGASTTMSYFTGELDEIRIWHQPRDPFEVLDYYATRLVDTDSRVQLAGYYPLEESGVTTTLDNQTAPSRPPPEMCGFETWGGGAGGGAGEGGAGGARQDQGELVGFSFSGSPWVEPGAF
jgi:hypothetical protein